MVSPTFNLYSIILFVGLVQGLVVAAVLARRALTLPREADGWLAGLLAALVVSTIPYIIGFAGLYNRHYGITFFPFDNLFLIGPLALLHVRAVATPHAVWDRTRRRLALASFVPAALFYAVSLTLFARSVPDKRAIAEVYGTTLATGGATLALLVNGAFLVLAARAAVPLWRMTARGGARSGTVVAGRWTAFIVAGLAVVVALDAVFGLVVPFAYTRLWWAEAATSLFAYVASVGGLAFSYLWRPGRAPQVATSDLCNERERLDAIMRQHRPHLDPGLTASTLAALAGMTQSQLSAVLAEGYGRGFAEFVNGHRVEEVQARLRAPGAQAVTLLAIAFESGFASKATFNRAFKGTTGLTPSAWWAENRGPQGSQYAA